MATTLSDATGVEIALERSPRTVVSLVPSFTEMVCTLRLNSRLVGVTRFCVEPAAEVTPIRKIGGTKNPDVEQIVRLEPDLVLANKEENREEDVTALRDAGLTVYVGEVRSVEENAAELERVSKLLGAVSLKITQAMEAALEEQRHLERLRPRVRAACLIWRRPYMAAGGDTYIGDLLRVCGGINVFEHVGTDGRYPRIGLRELIEADPEVVLLPSEPYRFRERHAAELTSLQELTAAREGRIYLCDGQALTWWGVRTAEAVELVAELLDRARPAWRTHVVDTPELPPGLHLNVTQQDTVE